MGPTPSVVAPVTIVVHGDYDGTQMPLGEGEEKSSEEDKDITEDDDESGLHHGWMSRGKSNLTDLHILYQAILFQDLELEVVIPPPKA